MHSILASILALTRLSRAFIDACAGFMAQRVSVSPQNFAKLRCSTRQLGLALDAHRQPHRSRPHARPVKSLLATQEGSRRCTNIKWQEGAVERAAKEHLLKQKGCCLWFTGLSGSGKSTVACTLEHALLQRGHLTSLLDGDNIRCDTEALRLETCAGLDQEITSADHMGVPQHKAHAQGKSRLTDRSARHLNICVTQGQLHMRTGNTCLKRLASGLFRAQPLLCSHMPC